MLETVLQILILIVGLYIAFFKSYFQKKGTNLADKEDIKTITNEIESAKAQFTREIEQLKVNLQFENTVKSTLYTDRKNAVLNLYETTQTWYHIIENHLAACPEYDKEDLDDAEVEIEEHEFKTFVAAAKSDLYIADEDFFKIIDKYIDSLADFQNETINFLIDMEVIESTSFVIATKKWEEKKQLVAKYRAIVAPLRKNSMDYWMLFKDLCTNKISNL
jgi:hypothetical protein